MIKGRILLGLLKSFLIRTVVIKIRRNKMAERLHSDAAGVDMVNIIKTSILFQDDVKGLYLKKV